jgi:hypothetical protein
MLVAAQAGSRQAAVRGLQLRLAHRVRQRTYSAARCVANSPPPTLTIVTPVTGHRHMLRALRSVQAQDCAVGRLTHLIFVDGPRSGVDAASLQAAATRHRIHVVQLPYAVGTNGWLGVRVKEGRLVRRSLHQLMRR